MPRTDHQRMPCTGHSTMPYNGRHGHQEYLYSETSSPIDIRKRITASDAEISALAPLRHATCLWNPEDLNRHSGVISKEGTPQTTSTAEAPTIAGSFLQEICYATVGCLGLTSVPESPSPQPNPYFGRVRICSLCKSTRTTPWSPRLALRHRQSPCIDHQWMPCTSHPRMPYSGLHGYHGVPVLQLTVFERLPQAHHELRLSLHILMSSAGGDRRTSIAVQE
ncbi:hypothetical protein MRX96_013633 [Rhipicephalus microplus]